MKARGIYCIRKAAGALPKVQRGEKRLGGAKKASLHRGLKLCKAPAVAADLKRLFHRCLLRNRKLQIHLLYLWKKLHRGLLPDGDQVLLHVLLVAGMGSKAPPQRLLLCLQGGEDPLKGGIVEGGNRFLPVGLGEVCEVEQVPDGTKGGLHQHRHDLDLKRELVLPLVGEDAEVPFHRVAGLVGGGVKLEADDLLGAGELRRQALHGKTRGQHKAADAVAGMGVDRKRSLLLFSGMKR